MNDAQLLQEIQTAFRRRAETWRTNPNDSHGINTAVYVALLESGEAIADVLTKTAQGFLAGRIERKYGNEGDGL